MNTLELGRGLYASRRACKLTLNMINSVAPVGSPVSEYRPGGVTAPPKLSLAAMALEYIFDRPGFCAIYEAPSSNQLYVEFDKESLLITPNSVKLSDENISGSHIIAAHVFYALSSCSSNDELKKIFKLCAAEYKKDGKIDESLIYQFCDSYYYGTAKNISSLAISPSLTLAMVQSGFRSGALMQHELIYGNAKKYVRDSSMFKKESSPKHASSKTNNFMKEVTEGTYKIPYTWTEDQKKFIRPLKSLSDFVTNTTFESLVKKVHYRLNKVIERIDSGLTDYDAIGQDYINCLMVGKPGTGKTTVAYALSAATGLPVYTVALSQNSDEDEFEGKTKIVDGHPEFVSTDFLRAFEHGGIVMLEEPNLANPAVLMGALGQAIEFPFIIKKNGYETIHRHPLCVIVGAMNIGTAGSKPLSQAFANRFKQTYILDDPTRNDFIEILKKKTGKSDEVCTWVYDAYEKVVSYLKSPEVNAEDIVMNLSMRTCFGAIENMDEGEDARTAINNTLIGAIAEADLDIARQAQIEVLDILRNPNF